MAEDPRIARTRRRLRYALFDLIDEVGYHSITIDQLAERADVARSTFYSHYRSKDDLLFGGFEEWLAALGREASAPDPAGGSASSGRPARFHFSLPLLQYAARERKLFQETVVERPGGTVRRRLKGILTRVVGEEMERARGEEGRQPPAAASGHAHAVTGAFLGLLEWWFEESAAADPEEVDRIFQRTVAADV